MRKILFITISLCLATLILAQTKSQRRIYLWDVTLSMKGYKGLTPDIYGDVVEFLEQEINSITDESTEIIVLPFQESVLERWKAKADIEGKKDIIGKIKNYTNNIITNTNIVHPIKDVQANIISPDKNNILVLLTDGTQSEKFGGKTELVKSIQYWGEYAEKNYAYCLYVMLTAESIDNEVKKAIEQTENIDVVTEPGKMALIDLQPAALVKFNIKDDNGKPADLPLICKKDIALPSNIRVRLVADDNPYIILDQTVVLKDGKITFDVKYKQEYNALKNTLAEETRVSLHIELINREEIRKDEGKIVSLTSNATVLELINKPEKTLKIYVE